MSYTQVVPWLALLFAVVSFLIAVRAIRFSFRAAQAAQVAQKWTKKNSIKRSVPAKIAALEADLTQISDSIESIRKSHHKLRSRMTMRVNRERANGAENVTHDLNTQSGRDAARAELEADLAKKGMLHARPRR